MLRGVGLPRFALWTRLGWRLLAGLALPSLAPLACQPSPPERPPVEPPLSPGCNPLGGGPDEDCFTPFPSSHYQVRDASGVARLRLPPAVLPQSIRGVRLSPDPFDSRDGYSPATPMLAYFPLHGARIDATPLPGAGHVGESLLPSSPVQVFEYETGDRVPILAELDRNAGPGERQALVIQPQVRLRPATRYVVAIAGLRSEAGQAVAPLSGFQALRDGRLDAGSVRSQTRSSTEQVLAFLDRQGLSRSSLQLAWDFQTDSDTRSSARLIGLRDAAFSYRGAGGSPNAVVVDKVAEKMPGRPELLRQIFGRLQAPSFLTDDSTGRLRTGPDGEPQVRGIGTFPLTLYVPSCVERAMGPVPILLVGHGLFGSGQSELDSPSLRELTNRLCMVQVATDWLGLTTADRSLLIEQVASDFNQIVRVTDRLQQAHVNVVYLSRMLAAGTLDALPELRGMGRALADKNRIYYYGASNGGTQGLTQLALSPHIGRAALVVPGGFWAQLIWRSSGFRAFVDGLTAAYPDPLDRQVLIALSQSLWDVTDPATYASHVLRDPLPGVRSKRLLLHEGIGDAQVSNLVTRALVRSMGLSLLGLPVEAVFGVGQVIMGTDSAYVQYDIGQQPRPGDTNVPPEKDNAVHRSIGRLEAAKTQVDSFLREDGRALDTCGGRACVFPPPTL